MKYRARVRSLSFLIVIAALCFSPSLRAQDDSGETKGVDSGNYNIQQSIEFGYRANWVNGDHATYDTFVNLGSGVRLFDYSLNMRSLDHNGFLFDNLSFTNFGYGGDPNDVTRLRIDKNKWYEFSLLFRRDKNFWDWRLLTNPLNPASSFVPTPVVPTPITFSPHTLDLVRRMQDYNLTLFPQSRLRFRLGYSRNVDEGPAFTTLDSGTEPLLNQNYRVTTNSFHFGVDYRFLPKTTLSYDQFLKYYKQDTVTFDQIPNVFPFNVGSNFQLANGAPVDLGLVWTATATGGSPCKSPISNPATTPRTVTSNCNGFINGTFNGLPLPSYLNVGRPRNFMPTEHFSFESTYFHPFGRTLEMTGSVGYSTGDTVVRDFRELQNFWTSRTVSRGSTASGQAEAKRVSVNADWSAVYPVSDKFRIVDFFRYDNWRIPGQWTSFGTNLFGTPPAAPGQAGLTLPIATFTPANFATVCPAPFTGPNCPQHSSGSLADVVDQVFTRFLGQNLKSNTFQLEYDFNRRLSGRIGYLYSKRTIADFNAVSDALEIYFPGGAGGNAGNFFRAARADCTATAGVLPADCTANADGSITEVGPESTNDTARNITEINEHVLLLGITARPIDKLRINGDVAFGYNDKTFARTSPRQLQTYKVHANYKPRTWATLDGAVEIHENRDNAFTVDNLEHDRMYSFTTFLSPNPRLSVDFGYSYWDYFSQADICYASGATGQPTTPCPNIGGASPFGAQSVYNSTDHFVYGDLMWKPIKRVTATVGYGGSFVRGTLQYFNQPQFAPAPPPPVPALSQVVLNQFTPSGTLDFNYLKPYASISIDLYKGLSYKTAWNYYGYNGKGPGDPVLLAPIGSRDFNGNTATFSVRYVF